MSIGEEATVDLQLSNAPGGLSGFDMALTLEDGAVAEVLAVGFPDYGLSDASTLPSNTVRLRAVDLNDVIPQTSVDATLASLQIRAQAQGTTLLTLSIEFLDDDVGNSISVQIVNAQIEVL